MCLRDIWQWHCTQSIGALPQASLSAEYTPSCLPWAALPPQATPQSLDAQPAAALHQRSFLSLCPSLAPIPLPLLLINHSLLTLNSLPNRPLLTLFSTSTLLSNTRHWLHSLSQRTHSTPSSTTPGPTLTTNCQKQTIALIESDSRTSRYHHIVSHSTLPDTTSPLASYTLFNPCNAGRLS